MAAPVPSEVAVIRAESCDAVSTNPCDLDEAPTVLDALLFPTDTHGFGVGGAVVGGAGDSSNAKIFSISIAAVKSEPPTK